MKISDHVIIPYGRYPFDADGSKRPIEWYILGSQNGCFLLLSKYCLDWQPFHVHSAVTWENSEVRTLLNEVFLEEAFSPWERDGILPVQVKTSEGCCHDEADLMPDTGKETVDRIFLLSAWEAANYLPDDEARKAELTPYARQKGGTAGWWLRSRGASVSYAADVLGDGQVCASGEEVYEPGGIRPAMWVRF
jgi:hypothetical protein